MCYIIQQSFSDHRDNGMFIQLANTHQGYIGVKIDRTNKYIHFDVEVSGK